MLLAQNSLEHQALEAAGFTPRGGGGRPSSFTSSFSLASAGGEQLSGSARVEGGLLLLRMGFPHQLGAAHRGRSAPLTAVDLLTWNAELSGNVRFALASGRLRLHAEVQLGTPGLGTRLATAAQAFRAGADWLESTQRNTETASSAAVLRAPSHEDALSLNGRPLADLCREAGWSFTARRDGSLAVQLECPGAAPPHAALTREPGGTLFLRVDLLPAADLSALSLEAAAVFLLEVSGSLRLVRAAIAEPGGAPVLRFEAALDAAASPSELADAFAASSLASQLALSEVEAFQDETVARAYLAVHHRTP
jgi:hypothetical protein